jgi:hypothetical protein
MTDSIRVRVAARRAHDTDVETYLADTRIGVDQFFFASLIGLLDQVDPGGDTYPHSPRGHRSSEPYVRNLDSSAEPAAHHYKPLLRVWAIREHEGTLLSWGFVDRRELLISDILRATDAGYNRQDFRDVIIRGEAGRGGDYLLYDWVYFLGSIGLGLATNFLYAALTSLGSKVGLVVRTKKDDAKLALVAKQWQQRGITSPYALREWIDKQVRLNPGEVAKCLQLPVKDAKRLLEALGYAPASSGEVIYIRSNRRRPRRLRRRWEKHETTAGLDAW